MSLENEGLIKGLGQIMTQDTFRAVREKKSGLVQFNPVKMVNVCFARHDKGGRTYMFINPSDQRLSPDTKIAVNTKYGLTIGLDTEFAWGISAEELLNSCKQYNVDMRIHAFERGMQFNQIIEIIDGKITKDEEVEFDDYDWDCICPNLGG